MKNVTHKYKFLWRVTVACLAVLMTNSAITAPLFNESQVLTQPDGTLLHCFLSGDERKHFVHTKEQFIIKQNPITGYYCITDKKITDSDTTFSSQFNHKTKDAFLSSNEKKNKGNLTNLVVFARFADDTEYDVPFTFYDSLFNFKTGSSLQGYYQAASYNQLTVNSYLFPKPAGKQVRSYQFNQPRNYYTEFSKTNNIGYKNNDEAQNRKVGMIKEVLQYLSTVGVVPTSIKLDGNAENYVDNVTIILKGSSDSWGKILWPHHSTTKSGANGFFQQVNDIEVHDYIVLMSNNINVGVICHEFFHSLGAPDLYRYNNADTIHPLYMWDLMESQNTTPQFMTAYMKYKYGKWIDKIPTIIHPGEYSLNPLTMQDSNCYAINIAGAEECFVLEYRKPEGTYEISLKSSIIMQFEENRVSLFDGGLLAYRINNKQAGKGNVEACDTVPDEIYCYRPNGSKRINGEPWNSAFNAKYLKNEFGAKANPAPVLFNGDTAELKISNIYEDENKLYFTYHNDSITFIKWPADGELNANRHAVIIWDLLKTPCTYYIQISNNNTFTSLEVSEAVCNDSVFYSDKTLLPNQYYYARVGATSANNNGIIWSNTIYFRTKGIMEIYGYYQSVCAGNSVELQCDIFDSMLGDTEFSILLSDKNGSWDNPVLLETAKLQAGFNSIQIYLPDSLKTGYRYTFKLQSKNNDNVFATSNNFAIYGLARAKMYTATDSQTDDVEIRCKNSITTLYFLPDNSTTLNTYCNYTWTSKNCEIVETNYLNNSIDVKWNKLGKAEITLTATNQHGCQQVYTKNITVAEVPTVQFAAKSAVCAGQPVSYYLANAQHTITNVQVDGGNYKQNHRDSIAITWDKVPVGYVKITRTFENGCADSVKISQPINYVANVEIEGKDTVYKKNTEQYQVVLSNQAIDTDEYKVEWKSNYGDMFAEDNSANCVIYVDSAVMAEAGSNTIELEVTITNKNTQCSEILKKIITVMDFPNSIFEHNYTNSSCNITVTNEGFIIELVDVNLLNNIIAELYNTLGEKIATAFGQNTDNCYIATQHFPTGVYFLRVYSDNKLIYNNAVSLINEK